MLARCVECRQGKITPGTSLISSVFLRGVGCGRVLFSSSDLKNARQMTLATFPRRQSTPPARRIRRESIRRGAGLGQLSMVEHALCPLDQRSSLKENLVFDAQYFFIDKNRHQRKAHAKIVCPLGLSALDEFYLWGLLAVTLAQPVGEAELHATPHYCLKQLGIIDSNAKRGGRQYEQFAAALERLSAVTYRNDNFYDPIRAEHRRVSFGFLSYSLPLDLESHRAWRIAWDPIFFEFVAATGGHMQFDLATYRELDLASRRLFLFVAKLFARRDTTPRLNVRHLGEQIIGFAPSLDTKCMKVKVARTVQRLSQAGILAPGSDRFQKHGKGNYSLTLGKGPYFAGRLGDEAALGARDSALLDLLLAIGFDRATVARLFRKHPPRLLREWADITLAAKERFGPGFFKRSAPAYFVDNVEKAAIGNRTPPDWWNDLRKIEHLAAEQSVIPMLTKSTGDEPPPRDVDRFTGESAQLFTKIRDDLLGHFLAGGESERDAKLRANRLARAHMKLPRQASATGLVKVATLLRDLTS